MVSASCATNAEVGGMFENVGPVLALTQLLRAMFQKTLSGQSGAP